MARCKHENARESTRLEKDERTVLSCQVCGDTKGYHARGYCKPHYMKARSSGELKVGEYGQTGCKIEGCQGAHAGRGWCEKHYTRWKRHGDPLVDKSGMKSDHPGWVGDAATYNTMHGRLRKYRGSSRLYDCVDCGEQASNWSLRKDAANQIIDDKTGFPYSTELWDYEPRCPPCHAVYDIYCNGNRGEGARREM